MSDLVEREVVKEKMIKYGFTAPDMTVHEFIEDELPSATQQTGEWIHFAQSDVCSICGYTTGKYGSPSKYCPNCGNLMKGY